MLGERLLDQYNGSVINQKDQTRRKTSSLHYTDEVCSPGLSAFFSEVLLSEVIRILTENWHLILFDWFCDVLCLLI